MAKVAQLALLDLDEEELERFAGQLGRVLDRAQELEAFDVDDLPPTAHPYPLVNVVRPDEPERLDHVRAEALAAAPDAEDHQFKVPPALGEAP